ncbi:iris-like [Amblyomma americanum]
MGFFHLKVKTFVLIVDYFPCCIETSSLVCMLSVVDFRGSWKHAFDDRTATREVFFHPDGTKSAVVMLHQTGEFRLADCADLNAKALELPYEPPGEGGSASAPKRSTSRPGTPLGFCATQAWSSVSTEFSLILLLPDELDGLATVEERLSACTALQCFDQLRTQGEVQVSLPLFKVKQVTELVPVLSALGIHDLFTERAQLWGAAAGEKRVSLMRHAVAFETAPTGGSCKPRPPPPAAAGHFGNLLRSLGSVFKVPQPRARLFTVDRPFAFFVTCARPDAVMLLGSVRKVAW